VIRRWVVIACMTFTAGAFNAAADKDAGQFHARVPRHAGTAADTRRDVQTEIQFGRDVAARILARFPLDEDEKMTRYVNLVGESLALHAPRSELAFHFAILDTDSVNAYSAPGGYVFITRGLLNLMNDESELAAALAHEIAHVTLRHIVKALNIHASDANAQAGLAHLLSGIGDPTKAAFTQAVGRAVDILFDGGLRKADELEADRTAVVLLAETGYDPGALPRLLETIDRHRGDHTRIINKTHPPVAERVAALNDFAASMQLAGLDYPRVTGRFHAYFGR
jgi:predicted Zn-dependent protease